MKQYLLALLKLIRYNRRTGSTTKLVSGFKDEEFIFISGNEMAGVKQIQRLSRDNPEFALHKDKAKVTSITGNILRSNFYAGTPPLPIAIDVHAVKELAERLVQELTDNEVRITGLLVNNDRFEQETARLSNALVKTLRHNKQWADWSTSGGREWYTRPNIFDAAIQVIERKDFYRYMRLNQQLKALKFGRIKKFSYEYAKLSRERAYRNFITSK